METAGDRARCFLPALLPNPSHVPCPERGRPAPCITASSPLGGLLLHPTGPLLLSPKGLPGIRAGWAPWGASQPLPRGMSLLASPGLSWESPVTEPVPLSPWGPKPGPAQGAGGPVLAAGS